MNLIKQLKTEKRILSSGYALIGAGAGALMALLTIIACGNFYVYPMLCMPRHSPPQFLFYLMFLLLSALVGYICGMTAAYKGESRCRLNGVLFLVLAVLFLLLWYIAFFKTLSFIFALFLLLAAFLLEVLAVREIWQVGFLPIPFLVGAGLLSLWFLWLNITVILLN